MVPRRRQASTRRASSPRRGGSPTSTCCACRKSPTTFRTPGWTAARARISSRCSPRCSPATRRCPASRSTMPAEDGGRRRFGNLILSRLPVRQVVPAPAAVPGRSRGSTACRASRSRPWSARRSATCASSPRTSSGTRRRSAAAQVEALRAIYAEGHGYAERARLSGTTDGPYDTFCRPAATIITGDFNLEPDDPLHARMQASFADGTPPLADAWGHAHPGVPYPPTFKVYEKVDPGRPAAALRLHLRQRRSCKARIRDVTVDVERRHRTTSRSC